ncbi:MAG: flagellar biosynthesis repressor FlbT [Hyphomicrobiaceae bacterium]
MQRFHIGLRSGEKLYLNGAVIRVDRKVKIELLNDVTFLLEAHIIQANETHTALRQLYFIVQTMLIDPKCITDVLPAFDGMYQDLITTFKDVDILVGLEKVKKSVHRNKNFEALKILRGLFDVEAKILNGDVPELDRMQQHIDVKEAV